MNEHFCHICGTKFAGDVCPGCGADLEPQTEFQKESLPAASGPPSHHRSKPKAPPLSGMQLRIRSARYFLWIILVSMLALSVFFVLRHPTYANDFLLNIEQFAEIRKNIVYFWEAPEASSQHFRPMAFVENLLQFLRLAGDHIFNVLEEVSAIWT